MFTRCFFVARKLIRYEKNPMAVDEARATGRCLPSLSPSRGFDAAGRAPTARGCHRAGSLPTFSTRDGLASKRGGRGRGSGAGPTRDAVARAVVVPRHALRGVFPANGSAERLRLSACGADDSRESSTLAEAR
jgi:hypothetical protein